MITQRPRVRTAIVILIVIIGMCAGVVWLLSADARRQVEQLGTANADSTQWAQAQSEVELLALLVAIADARSASSDPGALDEVRTRFDVLYSRVRTLMTGRVFLDLRENEVTRRSLDRTMQFLNDSIPLIDAPDVALREALDQFQIGVAALRPDVRSASLAGVRLFSAQSDKRREQVSAVMRDLALLVGLMSIAITAVVIVLVIMADRARQQASRIALTHARLQTVISTSPDAIVVADTDGRILDFNEAATRIYGYTQEEAIGSILLELIVPEAAREEVRGFLNDLSTTASTLKSSASPLRATAKHKSGTLFPVEVSVARAESENGSVMVAFVRDISLQVREANELLTARDRAVAGERAKEEMALVMSHEMRTPLNGLLGTLELLSVTPLDDQQRRYAEVMARSGDILLGHVNAVLDIARADAGALRLENVPFDPHKLVLDVLSGLKASATQRGNVLSARIIGKNRRPVMGDPARMIQILINLIGNAIKFTENGRIDVTIDRQSPGHVEFRVQDSGIGIAPEDHDRIFQEFVTLDPTFHRTVEGTGLGLGIVRRLTTLMKGSIRVESAPGRGACFVLTLPLVDQQIPDSISKIEAPQDPNSRPRRSVLVVEDNEVNRMVVREMLHARNCHVVEAVDGQDGVEIARERQFDLIFMDISMPRMDGIAATKAIREGGPNSNTPIVALTAHVRAEDHQGFCAAGMTASLAKPLSFLSLDPLLDRLDQGRSAATPREAARRYLVENIGEANADRILERVLSEYHESLGRLQSLALDPSCRSDAARLAHKMAGAVALIGLTDLKGHLSELERALVMSGDTLSGIKTCLKKIRAISP